MKVDGAIGDNNDTVHWSYNGGNVNDNANDDIGSDGNNGVNGKIIPLATLATFEPMAPVASLAPEASLNGGVSSTIHMPYCTLKFVAPLESQVPLASMTLIASMMPMKRHFTIMNCTIFY